MQLLTIYDQPSTWVKLSGNDRGCNWETWLRREAKRIERNGRKTEIITNKAGEIALAERGKP